MIAIVDDEAGIRRGLQRLMRSAGIDARTYESDDFIADIASVDCVILDLQMPGKDGFHIQETMNARGIRVPVIILTGNDSDDSRARSLANGAAAYLCKPVDGDLLLQTIQSVLAPGTPT